MSPDLSSRPSMDAIPDMLMELLDVAPEDFDVPYDPHTATPRTRSRDGLIISSM